MRGSDLYVENQRKIKTKKGKIQWEHPNKVKFEKW